MEKMTKQEKLILNKRSLIMTYVWLGLSVLVALALLTRQILPASRTTAVAFLGTFWIPVLSLCMAVCMMVNKLLDRRILLELIKLDGYNRAAQEKAQAFDAAAESADAGEPAPEQTAEETTAGGEQHDDAQ